MYDINSKKDIKEKIILRKTLAKDLDFVINSENLKENSPYIGNWSREEHLESLSKDNISHLIIEKDSYPIGYMILVENYHKKIVELKRLVINEKNKGYGKIILNQIKKYYFEKCQTERLWLDVRLNNKRGQYLYKNIGFIEEGILRNAVYNNENFESIIIMSILKEEYFLKKIME